MWWTSWTPGTAASACPISFLGDASRAPTSTNASSPSPTTPGSTEAVYPRMTPRSSSFRSRSKTAEGAMPTCRAISAAATRALV